MPDVISVTDFIKETWDDYNSPTASNFVSLLSQCRNTINSLDEVLDGHRESLGKIRKSFKALHSSGKVHVENEEFVAENLEKLGQNADQEIEIGTAFTKFAVVTKELANLMKSLVQAMNNMLVFPLDNFLKSDGFRTDIKKPVDKAWKEYEAKFTKLEKEKKQIAKDAGLYRSEVTGPEVAEDTDRERRMFQLQMCEYLIKANEMKSKRGAELLQHLVEHYRTQISYFQDGLKTVEHFKTYIDDLVNQVTKVKQRYDHERRQLVELRDALKATVATYKESASSTSGYNLHQLSGNKAHGVEKTGSLLKRSEGLRKVWQKRKCWVNSDGYFYISHSDSAKEPVKLNLLTCQVKPVADDAGKKCFDLISSFKNRTYHFQADDQNEMMVWLSVLNNAKEATLMQAFKEKTENPFREVTKSLVHSVRHLPHNDMCCDCGAPDPEWLSVNLGVLICLECCGVHRDMGVHVSRTQSIVIDDISMAQLLIATKICNKTFNEIMEANLSPNLKPKPNSSMDEKKEFIRDKYIQHRFVAKTCARSAVTDDRPYELKCSIEAGELTGAVQMLGEDVDLGAILPGVQKSQTALHYAIEQENGWSLALVNFIILNSPQSALSCVTSDGNTALHICARLNRVDCMKLLLRVKSDLVPVKNADGQTALDIALEEGHDSCAELIRLSLAGKTESFENVFVDIGQELQPEVDYSDDELESAPHRTRSRGSSGVIASEVELAQLQNNGGRQQPTSSSRDARLMPPPSTPPAGSKFTQRAPLPQVPSSASAGGGGGGGDGVPRRRAPLPPGATQGRHPQHQRNTSDPGFTKLLSLPDRQGETAPPLPPKVKQLPGAQMVLPTFPTSNSGSGSSGDLRPAVSLRPVSKVPQHSELARKPSGNTSPSATVNNPPIPPRMDRLLSDTDSSTDTVKPSFEQPTQPVASKPPLAASTNVRASVVPSMASSMSFGTNPTVARSNAVNSNISPPPTAPKPNFGATSNPNPSSSSNTNVPSSTQPAVSSAAVPAAKVAVVAPVSQQPMAPPSSQVAPPQPSVAPVTVNNNAQQSAQPLSSSAPIVKQRSVTSRVTIKTNMRCRAIYPCEPDNDDELAFDAGEVIIMLEEVEEGWWIGVIDGNPNRKGAFPLTYVELISPS